MERDFMGLSSRESLAMVKEEMNNDGWKDSGFMKGSVVQRPFLKEVSSHLRSMSFNVSQDDKTKMMVPDPITSAGFFAIPSTDVFDSIQKSSACELQNINGANVKQPLLGGIPVTVSHSVLPIIGVVAGITESCAKPSTPASQLTIFYSGTVNVFDDISPEKAQAIMLLAGNDLFAPNMAQPKDQAADDGMHVSQPINIPPCSGLPSPLSVSSDIGAQSDNDSSSNDEFPTAKASGVPTTSVSKVDTPKAVNAAIMLPSAVPQARKASLARFLEKRKERVMNTAPYSLNEKSEGVPMQNTMITNISAITCTNILSAKQG